MTLTTIDPGTWAAGIAQLLDEHHLVVLADDDQARARCARLLVGWLGGLPETEVLRIHGRAVSSLAGLIDQLRAGSGRSNDSRPTVKELIRLLRDWPTDAKRRYLLWEDADVMLESDVALFGQMVNALCGVAVEREHLSLDPLVVQRVVFLGGAKLGAYAEDPSGQFCTWLTGEAGAPFWEAAGCVERPPVLTYRLEG